MKKNLIVALALVFVFGIAGTAFAAANPFVDVPAKHWAYDAVSKLAQAGILDGYGDGTYRGERLASRYEMAQATAKAMSRADKADAQLKALIDKLAVEFAAELNNLGVRVAKLEKNASSIKFWGDSRLRFISNSTAAADQNGNVAASFWDQRIRIYAKAEVNDKATFYGRIMANWRDLSAYGTSYEASIYWDYGYFEWKFAPNMKMAIGRQQIIGAYALLWSNGGYDSIQFNFGAPTDKFQAKIAYGDVGTYTSAGSPSTAGVATKPVFFADLNYIANKDWKFNAATYWSTNADNTSALNYNSTTFSNGYPFQVYVLGFEGKLNQDFKLRGQYFWNVAKQVTNLGNDEHYGWMAELWYKGADPNKVGSWGVAVNMRDIKPWALDYTFAAGILANSVGPNTGVGSTLAYGMKGIGFQANYTISKNAVLTATYEALSRNSAADSTRLLPFYYIQMNVTF